MDLLKKKCDYFHGIIHNNNEKSRLIYIYTNESNFPVVKPNKVQFTQLCKGLVNPQHAEV